MAFRTWAKLLSATLGVGALAGASQLGLAYGLGIVRLTRVLDVTARDQWTAQLAWAAWIPMVAAVAGALAGAHLLRRWAPAFRSGVGTEIALAFAAAIGAAVVVPLTMQPARTAQVAGVNPVVVIAICAGLGALVGIFAAWGAVAQAVARWSLIATAAAIWTVALVSVSPSLGPGEALPAVRLGVFDAGFLSPAVTQRTALATMPALALLLGAILGWAARRRDLPTLTIALAGMPGPALLTIAYLIAGPGSGDARYQVVPYWAAMTATGAGVLGSVLAAVLRRSPAPDEQDDTPTEDRPPLPKRVEQPASAIAAAAAPSPTPPATPAPTPATAVPGTPAPATPASTPSVAAAPSPAPAPARPPVGAPARPQAEPKTDPQLRASDTAVFDTTGTPAPKRPKTRRSSVADAFTGRTGEFPTRRPASPTATGRSVPLGEYASPDPAPFDAFARGKDNPGAPAEDHPGAGSPARPAIHGPASGSPTRAVTQTPAAAPKPYVPEPATRPIPPEALQAPTAEQPRSVPGRLGRSLRPFARGRAAEPLTPEPTMVSAPLPQPQPVTPPLSVTPAPKHADVPQQAPAPDGPAAGSGRGRFGLRKRKDEDYVDWVSGLGS
ncbi:hypothetical protein COUCH_35050 [Couchioplanes caeruleus]|uniref:hypothetical protein n=1 Tax=Couchioplanes caeruleus TaxID=56438 RepID=UPI0020C16497|nr:hypothetical protein [Couchioplanes caeruleus]UQU64132.1 hypothetical protein COUCH_35050 [Couchioplanes caeruleus]